MILIRSIGDMVVQIPGKKSYNSTLLDVVKLFVIFGSTCMLDQRNLWLTFG